MALRILHTSDLHLGMKFPGYEGAVRESLVEARFESLARLVQLASEKQCDIIVVAGDLFDRVGVSKTDVARTARILSGFEGALVAVLPGNHDYLASDGRGPWDSFCEQAGDKLLLLRQQQPYDLTSFDIDGVLYPGPCTAKHSPEDAISWVRDCEINTTGKHHIGIAHGSLQGFSPDFAQNYYPMTLQALESMKVQLWLLGHTHVRFPDTPGRHSRIFYAGTPEPDGFDCTHRGTAWVHELSDDGSTESEAVTVGEYHFRHDQVDVTGEDDLRTLRRKYEPEENRRLLLKLALVGRVPADVYSQVLQVQQEFQGLVSWLEVDDSQVSPRISARDIDDTFTKGLFPHRLLTRLVQAEADVEALHEAHRLILETRT